MRFKFFIEDSAEELFGFKRPEDDLSHDEMDNKPLKAFDTELMMRYLSRYRVGMTEATVPFMNEIRWGEGYGAVRLEVTPRMLFLIQREGRDLEGTPRWITKRVFQLNRRGYGSFEPAVAVEVYDYISEVANNGLEGPFPNWDGLMGLTEYMATKLRRCAQPKFLFRGIKRVSNENYQIIFECGAQGVELPHHRRVEQNVTDLSYDEVCGTVRCRNYNVSSKVGGERSWNLDPCYLDCWFFPSQDRSEIADPFLVLMKYY
jgi:hypothetical protein